ncbi:hypothetical protein DER44DRAFT_872969 [Fusarium oxysporum]|nr:hypothetical protein DER44DRAFT_872969 [Fusarium oxysporum]
MNSRLSSWGGTPSASGYQSIDSRIESSRVMFGSPENSRLPDISKPCSADAGYFSPDLRHPGEQSLQPAQSSERNMETQEAVSQSLRQLVESRITSSAGMFGGPEGLQLLSVREFRSQITGYFSRDFNVPGPQFPEKPRDQCEKMDDLFWDLMLRIQPNSVTSDVEVLRPAVDLVLDVVVGRMLPQLRPEYHPVLAESHLQALSRRLRALELRLQTDMGTCGKLPKMLCGCIIPIKRPNNKDKLWTRHLTIRKDEKGRSEDQGFKFRDLAGLLRLVNFSLASIALMDDEIKRFIPKKDYNTADELKAEWIYVLCHGNFRSSIVLSVMGIVSDAVAFSKKDGTQIHREECDLWAPETVPEPLTTAARLRKLTTFRLIRTGE